MKTWFPFLMLLTATLGSGVADDRPNILFLLSDDQSWNGLSCRMHPDLPQSASAVVRTPHLERLAAEGMRFSAAYSPASVCSPTRISLQTGKSPAQSGWTKAAPTMTAEDAFELIPPRSRKQILEEEVTVGQMLQGAGYATAHFGKWHLGGGDPARHGYDASDGATGNQDAAPHFEPNPVDIFGMGERAMEFMTGSQEEGRPFFIQMSYHALHYPENAPPALVAEYRRRNPRAGDKALGQAALAEELDRGIGLLLDHLESSGLSGSTYVIYMSDNGGSARGALRGGKGGVWEGGIRVPLIIRGPDVAPNSWCHQRVVGYDFFPTFCEWAQVPNALPEGTEGGSITHLLKGATEPVSRPREELVFHFPHYQGDTPHSAILLGRHKLLRFYEDDSLHLFDLEADLAESRNLADREPELARQLADRLDAYLGAVGAQLPVANPKSDPERRPVLKGGGGKPQGGGGKSRD